MSLADRYVFFNQHLNLPRFTSEDEVSTAAQPAPSAPSCDGCHLPNLFAVITISHWPNATIVLFIGANGSAATLQVLSTAEVEMMWANMANHKAYLDQGFVRKLSARWSGLSKNQQAAVATRPSTSMAGIVVADTAPSDAFGTEKAPADW